MKNSIQLQNGFVQPTKDLFILIGEKLEGEIQEGDLLVIDEKIEVPIQMIERNELDIEYGLYKLYISQEYSASTKWWQLYGKRLEIKIQDK